MKSTRQKVSRRGLLAAAAAGSAIAIAQPAGAFAAAAPPGPLIQADRIGNALTRLPSGRAITSEYTVDLHDRLTEWLRFWWANAPGSWRAPLEVTGEVTAGGGAFVLTAVNYTAGAKTATGFTAATENTAYWATLASLHRFFAVVRPETGRVRVAAGAAAYTASPEQQAFLRHAHQQVWQGRGNAPHVRGPSDWLAYTKATLRRGLGTES